MSQIDEYLAAIVALFVAFHVLVLAVAGLAKLAARLWPPAQKVVDVCAKLSTDIGWVLDLLRGLRPPKGSGTAILLVLCWQVTACAGTFEEARLAAPQPRAERAAPGRCEALSDRQSTFAALGVVSASLAAPTGLVAIPVESDIAKSTLIGGAVLLAAGAAGAELVSDEAGKAYVREGCAAR